MLRRLARDEERHERRSIQTTGQRRPRKLHESREHVDMRCQVLYATTEFIRCLTRKRQRVIAAAQTGQ